MDYQTMVIKKEDHCSETFKTLNEFRRCHAFCDVFIRADHVEITGHKAVLAACSPYFRAMFTADFLEARQSIVNMKHVDPQALVDVIDYFYTGELVIDALNVEGIMQLANTFQLDGLIENCEMYMRRNMSIRNCLGLQSLAKYYGLPSLHKQAIRFISWYFQDIYSEEEYLLLPENELQQLVSNDFLRAPSEEFIYEAVLKWLFFDYNSRSKVMLNILPHIRFPLMNPNYLQESNLIRFLIDNFALGQDYIKEALVYQSSLEKEMSTVLNPRYKPRHASEDIFVIGGWSNGQKLTTVQCFNVDTLKWSTIQNMTVAHVAREYYFRVVVANEELYTVSFDKVLRFDPIDNTWQRVADGPEIQCKWAGVCELDGYIYVVGGNSAKSGKRFNTDTLEWQELSLMRYSRYYPGVAVLKGKIYAIGGLNHNWMSLKTCERYNPLVNQWEEIARMHTPRWSLGVAAVGNELFAIGGSHNVEQFANTVEVYNVITNKWEESVAPLNEGRRCLGVAVVNDQIYVVGGRVANTIEYYNKETNEWKVIGSVQTCCNFGCVALRII